MQTDILHSTLWATWDLSVRCVSPVLQMFFDCIKKELDIDDKKDNNNKNDKNNGKNNNMNNN